MSKHSKKQPHPQAEHPLREHSTAPRHPHEESAAPDAMSTPYPTSVHVSDEGRTSPAADKHATGKIHGLGHQ
jgi:hypothetical protein